MTKLRELIARWRRALRSEGRYWSAADELSAALAECEPELSEEQVERIVRLHHNPIAQVFLWPAMTADLNALLRREQKK